MKDIEKIRLVFENLETCYIDAEEIGFICVDDIQENIHRIACNSIANLKTAKNIFIELLIDRPINLEGDDNDNSYQNTSLFKRIENYNDITSIEVYYKDGTTDEIYPTYKETASFSNEYQHSIIEKNNQLYIVISKQFQSFRDKFGEDFNEHIAK